MAFVTFNLIATTGKTLPIILEINNDPEEQLQLADNAKQNVVTFSRDQILGMGAFVNIDIAAITGIIY